MGSIMGTQKFKKDKRQDWEYYERVTVGNLTLGCSPVDIITGTKVDIERLMNESYEHAL